MLIIDKDNLQAFINKAPYGSPEGKEMRFIVSFTIQINGKIKTTYADLLVLSEKDYLNKNKNCADSLYEKGRGFVIDYQTELLNHLNILHHLWYDCWDTMLMRDKISQYISNFF